MAGEGGVRLSEGEGEEGGHVAGGGEENKETTLLTPTASYTPDSLSFSVWFSFIFILAFFRFHSGFAYDF